MSEFHVAIFRAEPVNAEVSEDGEAGKLVPYTVICSFPDRNEVHEVNVPDIEAAIAHVRLRAPGGFVTSVTVGHDEADFFEDDDDEQDDDDDDADGDNPPVKPDEGVAYDEDKALFNMFHERSDARDGLYWA